MSQPSLIQTNLRIFLEQLRALGMDSLYLPDGLLEQAMTSSKQKELDALRANIGDCTRCKLHAGRKNLVFGDGNPEARLVFVGEGPGFDEDKQGLPFVGKAGQLLNQMIEAMGLSRQEVYICNVVKCHPPDNRDPEPDEIATCEPYLLEQLKIIRPQVIVGLGRFAVQTLLQTKTPISRLRGNWMNFQGIKFMPTYHPAYLLRNQADKRAAWEDLQAVMREMGLKRPQKS
jgi:DNA polymerase